MKKRIFGIVLGSSFLFASFCVLSIQEAQAKEVEPTNKKANRINCYSYINGELNGYGSNCLLGLNNCLPQFC